MRLFKKTSKKRFTLTNPQSEQSRVLTNIRQNPPSAVPEDIRPRMKGLTDERKCIFALSVEYVSRGLAYFLHPAHPRRADSQ